MASSRRSRRRRADVRASYHRRTLRALVAARRSREDTADSAQPALERRQVHAGRRQLTISVAASSASARARGASVRDTGPGIAAERHRRVFEPFVQVPQRTLRHLDGTGLGSRDQPRPRARHGRRADGRERAGRGIDLYARGATRCTGRARQPSGRHPLANVGAQRRGGSAVGQLVVEFSTSVCRR